MICTWMQYFFKFNSLYFEYNAFEYMFIHIMRDLCICKSRKSKRIKNITCLLWSMCYQKASKPVIDALVQVTFSIRNFMWNCIELYRVEKNLNQSAALLAARIYFVNTDLDKSSLKLFMLFSTICDAIIFALFAW